MNRVTTLTLLGVLGLGLSAVGPAAPSRAAQDATPSPPTLVAAVRQATAPYQEVTAATAAGYAPMLGCVSGPSGGAMGLHYMNGALIGDGTLDASQPEALLYAPQAAGPVQLAGVEYLVLAEAWDASHDGPPLLDGQLFNFVGSPNRYRTPAFYELHVWAGIDNPNGMFADFNPSVSCDAYAAER